MNLPNPAEQAVAADFASARFRVGAIRGRWRTVTFEFPILIMAVGAIEPDGCPSEYHFRFELTGFPGTEPEVKIWDIAKSALLPQNQRPKGSQRVIKAFQHWSPGESVYRPWDRHSSAHNNFARDFPDLAWHPNRDLAFILEDLHGLLTSNATARGNRSAT